MKDKFMTFLNYFTLILTASVMVVSVIMLWNKSFFSENILWQMILASALTAVPSSVIPYLNLKTSKAVKICWLIHFILVFSITIILLKIFGWMELKVFTILLTFLAIVFIFFFTAGMHYYIDKRDTTLLNEELERKFGDDKE